MTRRLVAFLWLRWRIAMNRISRSDRRDWAEELSRIAQTILPWVAVLMMLPSALILGAASVIAGGQIAQTGSTDLYRGAILVGVRIALFVVCCAILVAPVVRAGRDRDSGFTRLLLLPIRHASLHRTDVLSGFADFWLAMLIPLLLGFPLGMIAGGRWATGLYCLLAGLTLLMAMASLNSAISYGIGLLLRKRGRAEWITFVFMGIFVLGFMIPGTLKLDEVRVEVSQEERREIDGNASKAMDVKLPKVLQFLPGELYVKSVVLAVDRKPTESTWRFLGVLVWALVLFQLSWFFFRRRIRNPDEEGGATVAGPIRVDADPPFGLAAPLWEICRTFVRLTLRTVRGKLAIFLNFPIVGLGAFTFSRTGSFPEGDHPLLQLGLLAAVGGFALTILSLHTVLLNQFAADGSGLAREWLAPIPTRILVHGKALAGGLMVALSTGLCVAASALAGPPTILHPWLLLLPLFLGSYLLLAPIHAMLSAGLPKHVDLSKLGQAGNPHVAAALLGAAVATAVVGVGALGIATAYWVSDSVLWAWVAAALWLGATLAAGWTLLVGAVAFTDKRRENLLLVAAGR